MANKKVSQLSATTESNDNVWLIMNNSGETETFRIKRVDLLSGTTTPPGLVAGTGTDSIKSSDSLTTTPSTASGDSNVALGNGADASGIGGVAIGKNAKANTGDYNIHISNGNVGSSSMGSRSIWLGGGNIFGNSQHISIGYSTYQGVGGGNQISIGHETSSQGTSSICIGNDYAGANRALGSYSITLGNGNQSNSRLESAIVGNRNTITGGDRNYILGNLSNISSTGGYNTILGCYDSDITGTTNNVVLIGLNGFVSPTEDNTTYTQNHASLGQTYNGYYDNLSGGTFTIDWNNGNTQKLFMTSDITLDFTNVKSGATYKLAIENGGTHNITSASAPGFTILCEGGSVPNITNNGKDLCVLEIIGTEIYVRHFSNFSVPV